MTVSPARRAAYTVVRRVFEDDAYADRALAQRERGPRRARARVRAAARVRNRAARANARPCDRRRSAVAPCASSIRRCSPRSGSARTSSATSTSRRTPRRTNPSSSCAPRGSSAQCRSRTPSCAASPRGSSRCSTALPEGPLKHSYPDWIYDVWVRDFGEDEALALMRAQNEPPETVVRLVRGELDGEPTDVPGAYRVARVDERALADGRVWPQSRGSQLAALAVASRTASACSTPAPRREARRRCCAATSSPSR